MTCRGVVGEASSSFEISRTVGAFVLDYCTTHLNPPPEEFCI